MRCWDRGGMGHGWQVSQRMKIGYDTGLREVAGYGGVMRALLKGLAVVPMPGSDMNQGTVEPMLG